MNKPKTPSATKRSTRSPIKVKKLKREKSPVFEELLCDSFSSSEDSDNSEPDHLQAEDFSFDFIKEIVKEAESKKNLRNH